MLKEKKKTILISVIKIWCFMAFTGCRRRRTKDIFKRHFLVKEMFSSCSLGVQTNWMDGWMDVNSLVTQEFYPITKKSTGGEVIHNKQTKKKHTQKPTRILKKYLKINKTHHEKTGWTKLKRWIPLISNFVQYSFFLHVLKEHLFYEKQKLWHKCK